MLRSPIAALDQGHNSPSIKAVRDSEEFLEAAGCEMPSWEALAQGAIPHHQNREEEIVDTTPHQGWQHPASAKLEQQSLDELRCQLTEPKRACLKAALWQANRCPISLRRGRHGLILNHSAFSSCAAFAFSCLSCGRLMRVFGHHRAACHCGSVGGAGVYIGVGSRAGLPRNGRKGEDERVCEGIGPPPKSEPSRHRPLGSGGGRCGDFQRGSNGSGHHPGLQTGQSLGGELQLVELPSGKPGHERKGRVRNSLVRSDAPDWWSWRQTWAGDGLTKLPSSFAPPESTQSQMAHAESEVDGAHSSEVVRALCWNTGRPPPRGTTTSEADVIKDCAHEW